MKERKESGESILYGHFFQDLPGKAKSKLSLDCKPCTILGSKNKVKFSYTWIINTFAHNNTNYL